MFKKILVANRSEIALRVIRTAKELGLKTVAVYSEADQNSAHVLAADEAVCIGPAESKDSYLSIEKLMMAIEKTGADAVHPGYGFLSERAAFAKALEDKGICFIGPRSELIDLMGDKVKARKKMQEFGVPVVPGTDALEDLDEAEEIILKKVKTQKDFKFPLLIKSSGGGGGKGMRKVHEAAELRPALERAQSESLQAFGTPLVFVERYIENPRHIEIQVLGDGKNALHFFERECSLQRRHQKVVEEALSPSLSEATREKMSDIAAKATKQLGYNSVGTLEFIVSPEEDFYFLEMNTRIQVEHPVTEWITGSDLIREQILVAQGHSIALKQDDILRRGHAIEVRLYAEDAENNFMPRPGKIHFLRFPEWTGVRVDSTMASGSLVSSHYDPMIAKISCWAPDREQCRQRLIHFLRETKIEGLVTNRSFLIQILQSDFFQSGRYHTGILEKQDWRPRSKDRSEIFASLCLQDYLRRGAKLYSEPLSTWQEESI
ncbi:MAG: acetyl-CoA carboxylase biotin carboxylase subunit [Bdellovibrionota bacterium]